MCNDEAEAVSQTVLVVLDQYRTKAERRFQEFLQQPIPETSSEALRRGILQGRQEGYSEGLVDGARLGLTVGFETMEALLSQPVVFA